MKIMSDDPKYEAVLACRAKRVVVGLLDNKGEVNGLTYYITNYWAKKEK